MSECRICFREPVVRDGLCQKCLDWQEYWDSLTPEQRQAEIKSMDRYGAERGQR